ncbi:translocation/assembly module TamB domain-containing protein [Tropicimonas sp. TH_r6]|uniref:translocation/assembly module TamB domain-containing protein n=1 Tax=Tropicimonas sp. TH_r6 TaxID=3082085 RepID=UPI00295389E1|nr:translocation/assembly module TamB domain-containing protein [Tropicimonas sp. TH_r6]MDV7142685.1 translocation/assembly module TamB domain-containing protein [Tropicimonas sp. TH_r6]
MQLARHAALASCLLLLAPPALAQDDEDGGGMIQRFLQDKLSTGGREVKITGFEGLLSGAARLGELTIADDQGVWLTLRNAELDWSRTALLRGNLSVETLVAGELIVARLPAPAPADSALPELPDTPKAEASGFSLPELPVSIRIDRLAIERAELGETVLGQEAVLGLEGGVQLAGGEGKVDLETRRLDGPEDHISLHGSFVNESRTLSLDLEMEEEAGGLVTSLLKLPGEPSVALKIAGEGPLTDFTADIALATDGAERITGSVNLTGNDSGEAGFTADIGGDITPLLPAEFHDFFGTDIRLQAEGSRDAEGAFELPGFELTAQALSLEGSVSLGADGLPTAFTLDGDMGRADGAPLRLPVSGPGTYLDAVTLDASFDAAQSDRWQLTAEITGVEAEAATLDSLALDGTGRITTEDGAAVTADLLFDVAGLAMADPGLAEAIGDTLTGGAGLDWTQGGALNVTRLYAEGEDYDATLLGDLRIADRSLKLSGQGQVNATDLARFSTIAGRPLTGQVEAALSGAGDPLGGQFAVTADVEGTGLSIGQETADRLLDGPVTLSTALRRDTEGTVLDHLELRSRAITADAKGKIGGGASDLGFDAALSDVSLVLPGHEGELTLAGTAKESAPGDWQVGLDLAGPYALAGKVAGRVHPGESDVTLDLSLPDIAPLVPGHEGPVRIAGRAGEEVAGEWDVDLDVDGPYALTAAVEGLIAPGKSDVSLDIALPDLAPLVPGHSGAVALTGRASETGTGGWDFDLDGSAPYEATVALDGRVGGGPGEVTFNAALPDLAPLVPSVPGPVRVNGKATDAGDGLWQVDLDASGPQGTQAAIDGVAGGGQSDLDLDISVPDLGGFVPQISGPLRATGNAAETGDGRWAIDFDATGPQNAQANIDGAVGASGTELAVILDVPQVSAFAPGVPGALNATAKAAQQENGAWELMLDANGPYASTVNAGGSYGAGASQLAFEAALPDVGALVPAYSGPLTLKGDAKEAATGRWNVVLDAGLPYKGSATVAGTVEQGATAIDLTLDLPSIAPFAPGVTGGFSANGNLSQSGDGYAIKLDTRGPQGVSSNVSGTVASDFATMALNAKGTAPLALANAALSPHSTSGTAAFDISVNGAPSLEAVSGTVTVSDGELAMPTLRQSLNGITVNLGLNGAALQIDASANSPAGGSLGARGSLQLTGMVANLEASLNSFTLTDPTLFTTVLDGGATISGPLTGAASIAGRINVGRTEIRIPDGGLGFGGAIPDLKHVGEPAGVFLTRKRAGLVKEDKASGGSGGGGGGPAYALDIRVNAPEQIFIRGRGLDTELGGALIVGGTTASPTPVGEIEVIRGRLDILGKRLDMDEGTVSMAGGLKPYLDLTASSTQDDFEFLAVISGPVDDPQFKLTSVPDLPEDEVLARFLFGKSVTDLSPLQAVQLASAVANLTGRGGGGLTSGLREGLGLDDLDLATTDDGGTEVRAGKYLSENIYTEFVADSEGDTEIDLNIDLHKNVTIKGTASSSGDSSIGVYFERDY